MKRKILLLTDFSANATQAIKYALELYKDEVCEFYFMNVFYINATSIDSIANMVPGSKLYETTEAYSESGLAKLLNMFALKDNRNPKHTFQTISTFNNPLEAIKIAVEEKDIDMIVMGTKGETNSASHFFGSTAVSVMEKVRNCPVIVVTELANIHMPKEIVFPTSFKTHFKRRELVHLIEIAQHCNASIKVVHVSKENSLSKEQLNGKKLLSEYFEGLNYSYHTLSSMPIPSAINCFVESRESDMVVFVNKKHILFGSILTRPLVKDISFYSKVPILVLHDLRN